MLIELQTSVERVQDIQRDLWNLNRELTRFHQEPDRYEVNLDYFDVLRDTIRENWDELFVKAAKRKPDEGIISNPVYQTTRSAEIIPNARAYANMIMMILEEGNITARNWAKGEIVRLFQAAMGEIPEANPYDEFIGKE